MISGAQKIIIPNTKLSDWNPKVTHLGLGAGAGGWGWGLGFLKLTHLGLGLGLGAGCSWARWACAALEGATDCTA